MPPSGNGNRGNGNPFKRNSPNDPNGNQKGNNSGGPQPFWKSPWLWGVLLVVMAVAGFQLFAGAGTQTIDTKDGFALLKTENVAYAKIIDNKQLVQLELKSNFTKTDPDTNKPHNYGKKVQFYYTFAQGAQVVQAVEKADPSKGWTSNMQQTSMVSYLISSILPFIIMIAVFWFLMSRMGGASGMFGMGGKKNNGKLLEGQTPSTKFSDVAGEDSAVQEVEEIKDFLKDPSKYKALAPASRAACCCTVLPEPVRRCSPVRSQARRVCRSMRWRAPTSSRCSSALAPPASVTCSMRRRKTPRPSSSSTRSTPSDASVVPA